MNSCIVELPPLKAITYWTKRQNDTIQGPAVACGIIQLSKGSTIVNYQESFRPLGHYKFLSAELLNFM